jgi:hypothetical protein
MLKIKTDFKATEVFWSPGTPHVGGTALLFFCPVTIIKFFLDPRGRYTRVDYVWEGEEFSSVCLYAPADSDDRPRYFQNILLPFLSQHPLLPKALVSGD